MRIGITCFATQGGSGVVVPEVAVDGETGYLVPFGDTEGIADRAAEILLDGECRRALAAQARQRAAERFPRERVVDQYEAYYRSLLGEQRR